MLSAQSTKQGRKVEGEFFKPMWSKVDPSCILSTSKFEQPAEILKGKV